MLQKEREKYTEQLVETTDATYSNEMNDIGMKTEIWLDERKKGKLKKKEKKRRIKKNRPSKWKSVRHKHQMIFTHTHIIQFAYFGSKQRGFSSSLPFFCYCSPNEMRRILLLFVYLLLFLGVFRFDFDFTILTSFRFNISICYVRCIVKF